MTMSNALGRFREWAAEIRTCAAEVETPDISSESPVLLAWERNHVGTPDFGSKRKSFIAAYTRAYTEGQFEASVKILLGAGKTVFGPLTDDIRRLIETVPFSQSLPFLLDRAETATCWADITEPEPVTEFVARRAEKPARSLSPTLT